MSNIGGMLMLTVKRFVGTRDEMKNNEYLTGSLASVKSFVCLINRLVNSWEFPKNYRGDYIE